MTPIDVAVAVIVNHQQEVLLSWRRADQPQGGLWEFPGGKREVGESIYDALVREIDEELGLQITQATPLVKISHDYGDKYINLDVWQIIDYHGEPIGKEGQSLRWCLIDQLVAAQFPAANVAIIDALQQNL